MIFYHVSTALDKDGYFYPRQPSLMMELEVYEMDRVCVAPSIADCFSAIPSGGSRLDELNLEQAGLYKVFRIDTEKLNIPESAILTWKTVFEKAWVPDAEWTEEHWITESFTVPEEDIFYIHLTDWEEEVCDLIPYAIYQEAEKHYEGDYFQAYNDITGEMIPCMNAIKDVTFTQDAYGEGASFYLHVEDDEIIDRLLELAKPKFGVTLSFNGMDEITVEEGELTVLALVSCMTDELESFEEAV